MWCRMGLHAELLPELRRTSTKGGGAMTDKLLPCPFCGGEAHTYKNNLWHVGCEHAHNNCVTMSAFVTEAEAIAAWNARADDKRIAELELEVKAKDSYIQHKLGLQGLDHYQRRIAELEEAFDALKVQRDYWWCECKDMLSSVYDTESEHCTMLDYPRAVTDCAPSSVVIAAIAGHQDTVNMYEQRISELESLVRDWCELYESPDYGDCIRLRKRMHALGLEADA